MIVKATIMRTVPLTIRWIFVLWLIYVSIFTVFRLSTVILFRPPTVPFSALLPSFWLGFRFDAKWIAIVLLPIAILSIFVKLSPFYSERNKRIWSYYLAVITFIILFFFGADFGNFSYNHTRINASALNFAEDPLISMEMLWQSYPMVWILASLALTVFLISKIFKKTHVETSKRRLAINASFHNRWHVATIQIGRAHD